MTNFRCGMSAILIFFLAGSLCLASEAAPPVLKSNIIVTGPTISLADLVEGENLPLDGLFVAPAPGQSGTIRASRIVDAATKVGVKTILGDLSGGVTVTRKGRKISGDEIQAALLQAIIMQTKLDQPELTLTASASDKELFVEEGASGKLLVSGLVIDPETLHFKASLSMQDSAALASSPRVMEGQITDLVDVPVSTRTVTKNEIISPADIKIERRERKTLAGTNVIKPSLVSGQAARATITTGSILTEDMISKPVLVDKAMAVSVTYAVGGLNLTLRGKANEPGALGDMISILNPQSKKIIFATVTGPGTVAVMAPPVTNIASRQSATSAQ